MNTQSQEVWGLLTEACQDETGPVNCSWARVFSSDRFKQLQYADFEGSCATVQEVLPRFFEEMRSSGRPLVHFNDAQLKPKHVEMGVTAKVLDEVAEALLLSIDARHMEYGNSWFAAGNAPRFKELAASDPKVLSCALKYVLPELLKSLAEVGRSYAWFAFPDDGRSLGHLIRNGRYEARSTHCSHMDGLVYGVAKLREGAWELPNITGIKLSAAMRILVRDTTTGELHALLVRKPNGSGRDRFWGSPGGYLNAGDSPPEAVLRTFEEKVGYNQDAISHQSGLYSYGHSHQSQYWPHLDDINYRLMTLWETTDPTKLNLQPKSAVVNGQQKTELSDVQLFKVDALPEDCSNATRRAVTEAANAIETGVVIKHDITSFGWGAHTKVDKYVPELLKHSI
ncbi:MAG: NUDIX domain-containing protein [Chlamydiia bacterium]|nr:NUDIX domain-containing protein [Chlamydiia bacterium]